MALAESSQRNVETETHAVSGNELHFLDVLTILSKRRRFILLMSIGAAVLATVVVLLIPSQYTATTLILPPAQSSTTTSPAAILSQLGGAGILAGAGANLGIRTPGDMYVSLLRSRTVEDSVIQRFGLMARYHADRPSRARTAFERHTKVTYGSKDGLIIISVSDGDPARAAEIANGYVAAYRKLSANLAITEASQRRLFFQQQLLEAKESLATAEEALKGTQQSTGVLQIDSQARSLIESAAALRAQVMAKEVQVRSMESYATEENPDILLAKQELAALQAQLSKLGGTDQDSGLIVPRGKVSEVGMEYIRRVRDVKYYDTVSQLLATQFELAKLDEARQGAVLQVVDVAIPPDSRSFPQRKIIVVLATLLGFFLSCGWCISVVMFGRLKAAQM
jgi:tyrosine-protein kinase Etk/Wzc